MFVLFQQHSILWKGSLCNWVFANFSVHGGFWQGKNVQDCQKYFVVDGPSLFSKNGSVTLEKCPSNEMDRVITMGSRHP